nr:MAG TPA: hypothetical protein [Caudoviricetes sp.]
MVVSFIFKPTTYVTTAAFKILLNNSSFCFELKKI